MAFPFLHLISFSPLIPEFQPGVPWKGIQNIDPESDPYVTPGSVLGGTATSPIVDTDHQLLRDNTTGKTMNSCYVIILVILIFENILMFLS